MCTQSQVCLFYGNRQTCDCVHTKSDGPAGSQAFSSVGGVEGRKMSMSILLAQVHPTTESQLNINSNESMVGLVTCQLPELIAKEIYEKKRYSLAH